MNGQNTDFVANIAGEVGQRVKPVAAIGGAGFLAIGWQDASASQPGVFVRRFPLP